MTGALPTPEELAAAGLGPLEPLDGLRATPLPSVDLAGFDEPVALAEVRRP